MRAGSVKGVKISRPQFREEAGYLPSTRVMNPNIYSFSAGAKQNEALEKVVCSWNTGLHRSLALDLHRKIGSVVPALVSHSWPKRSPFHRSIVEIFPKKKICVIRRYKVTEKRPAQGCDRRVTLVFQTAGERHLAMFKPYSSREIDG